MNSPVVFFVAAPRGLEELLAAELTALGLSATPGRGGVNAQTDLAGAYRACLWSRLANRILLPLAEFAAGDDEALYAGTRRIDWAVHLDPDAARTLAVRCTGQRPAIAHTRFAEQRVKDAIVDQFRARTGARPSVDVRNPDLAVHVHLDYDRASIAIDLSGDSLHRRGYREPGTRAPLKENLAAAMLLRAGWPEIAAAGGALCDPMTGSGTLAIEAAMIAADIAPAIHRTRFGFLGWRGHDDATWKGLIDEAIERQEAGLARLPPIHAFDNDPRAVRTARANVERAGLAGAIHVQRAELDSVQVPAGVRSGLVAVNPPYGERLGGSHELVPLYARLGEVLKTKFPGWRAIVLNGAGLELGLSPERSWQMDNGPIRCRLEVFALAAEPAAVRVLPAVDLANRVGKNLNQLRKWLAREAITCYRVYDADIPEYALAVDVYGTEQGDWLHVQEYQPPKSVAPARARARLRAALNTLPGVLEIKPEQLVFKLRQRQRGRAQYRRQAADGAFLIVLEGAARLYVNLTDYLDTGLFLDHRPVRQWLHDQAHGKRFLNLFCYTGAATVQAALGGARATTSVDLSNTYLDWLGRNLELNRLSGGAHKRIRADAREWLARCRESFDLIFLDPPSFSNSKKMDTALDIQRDHPDLIRAAMRCLAVSGTLIFSTNLRRFALDAALAEEFDLVDRTGWSIPRDFARSQRIHRCWFIRHRAAVNYV